MSKYSKKIYKAFVPQCYTENKLPFYFLFYFLLIFSRKLIFLSLLSMSENRRMIKLLRKKMLKRWSEMLFMWTFLMYRVTRHYNRSSLNSSLSVLNSNTFLREGYKCPHREHYRTPWAEELNIFTFENTKN